MEERRMGEQWKMIVLKPHIGQFVINELMLIVLCLSFMVWGGIPTLRLHTLAMGFGLLLLCCLLYRLIDMKRIVYKVSSEQIICEQGVFLRKVNYMELYRVVDFTEHQTLMQQLLGLKTIVVYSMDRSTPKLEMKGMLGNYNIVAVIRERVEFNKKRRGIYEITNR